MKHHKYTTEEVNWIINNYDSSKYTYEEFAKVFNNVFNTDVTKEGIKNKCRLLHIIETHYPYTVEQDNWLIENNSKYKNYDILAEDFNKKFNTNKSPRGIQSHCAKFLELKSNRQGYKKNHNTWNKLKVGEESVSNGYTYIKIQDTGIKNKDVISKQTYLWQKYNNKILPKGYIVIFLNQNKTDFSKDNLYAISRQINAIMCSNKWFTNSREHTLVAIKWCELFYALQTI